jgi:hypothetical protein
MKSAPVLGEAMNDGHVVLEGFSETTHANPLTRLVQAVSTLAVGMQRQLGAKSPFASYEHAATSSIDKGESTPSPKLGYADSQDGDKAEMR